MITLKYFSNCDEVLAVYSQLSDKLRPEMAAALNRASQGFKSASKKKIVAETYGKLKQKEINVECVQRATTDDLESVEEYSGRRIGLERFVPDLESSSRGKRPSGGVTAYLPFIGAKTIKAGFGARLDIGKKHLGMYTRDPNSEPMRRSVKNKKPMRDSYMASIGGKDQRVWLKGRFPIARMTFMAVPQMAEDERVIEPGMEKAEEHFFKQIDHRIDRLLKEH